MCLLSVTHCSLTSNKTHTPLFLTVLSWTHHMNIHSFPKHLWRNMCALLFFPFPCATTHTYCTDTQAPCPLAGPEGYTVRYAPGSCSLISSSPTHSGSEITSGGPVRHECYPIDNNYSGGRGRDPIPYLLTAPHLPPGTQVALKKMVRYK